MTEANRIEQAEDEYAAYLARQVRMIKNNRPAAQEMMDLNLENIRYKYDKLQRLGFTSEQAMQLIVGGIA